MALDPHYASVKLRLTFDGVDEATNAADLSLTPKTLVFNGFAELDTEFVKFGSASLFLPAADADWASVVLLMAFDNDDVDDSLSAHTVTEVAGDPGFNTADPKFGVAARQFNGETSGTDRLNVSGTLTDFDLGTVDATIEFWVKVETETGSTGGLLLRGTGTTSEQWVVHCRASLGVIRLLSGSATAIVEGTTVIENDGLWHHVAISRNSGTTRLFIDGVEEASSATVWGNAGLTSVMRIGNASTSPSIEAVQGRIDELRITKGVGRYTAGFTPPTGPFPRG